MSTTHEKIKLPRKFLDNQLKDSKKNQITLKKKEPEWVHLAF